MEAHATCEFMSTTDAFQYNLAATFSSLLKAVNGKKLAPVLHPFVSCSTNPMPLALSIVERLPMSLIDLLME
jgi:hypothetical protein